VKECSTHDLLYLAHKCWIWRLFDVCCLNWQPRRNSLKFCIRSCKPRADSAVIIHPVKVQARSNLAEETSTVQIHVMTQPKSLFKVALLKNSGVVDICYSDKLGFLQGTVVKSRPIYEPLLKLISYELHSTFIITDEPQNKTPEHRN